MDQKTGSEQLLAASTTLDMSQLGEVVQVSSRYGRILDWCQYGQPGIDQFCGTIRVKPGVVGKLIEDLLKVHEVRINFDVFPLGKPGIDEVIVNVRNRA